jgi:hypothetical protein
MLLFNRIYMNYTRKKFLSVLKCFQDGFKVCNLCLLHPEVRKITCETYSEADNDVDSGFEPRPLVRDQ